MPRKPKTLPEPAIPGVPAITDALLNRFAPDRPLTAAEVDSATQRFKKALIERALGAELSHHLGYPPGGDKPAAATNHRNGTTGKTVLTDEGPVPIAIPRDRAGTFEPQALTTRSSRSMPGA